MKSRVCLWMACSVRLLNTNITMVAPVERGRSLLCTLKCIQGRSQVTVLSSCSRVSDPLEVGGDMTNVTLGAEHPGDLGPIALIDCELA